MTTTSSSGAGRRPQGEPDRPRDGRLPRRQEHAVRRLRAQRDLRADRRGLLRDGRRRPSRVIKLSGIGCSSKSPAYFLGQSHGFNAVHGRMPSVATGAMLANRTLLAIGVSGDGDTGAIGIGQFVHLMRRNVPMIYIVENNGCYGLTKGQLSPTADLGSTLKNGVVNDLPPIDLCALAIDLGASFVARSFSGDKKQMLSLLKAAHRAPRHGDARRHLALRDLQRSRGLDQELLLREGPRRAARGDQLRARSSRTSRSTTSRARSRRSRLHDGSKLLLKKLAGDYDPTNKAMARRVIHESAARGEFATGLIYVEPDRPDFLAAAQRRGRAAGGRCRPRRRARRARRSTRSTRRCGDVRAPAAGRAGVQSEALWNEHLPSSSPTPSAVSWSGRSSAASSRRASRSGRCGWRTSPSARPRGSTPSTATSRSSAA